MDVYSFQYLFCLVLIHYHVIRYHVLNIFDTFDVFQYVSRCSSSNIGAEILGSLTCGDLGATKAPNRTMLVVLHLATGIARWWLSSMRMIPVRGMFYTPGMFRGCGFAQIESCHRNEPIKLVVPFANYCVSSICLQFGLSHS